MTEHDAKSRSSRMSRASDRGWISVAHAAAQTVRAVVVLVAVGGLVAMIILPALAVGGPVHANAAAVTVENLAAQNAQSIVVAPDVTTSPDEREPFTATTPDEIAKKKAEDVVRAAAVQAAKARVAGATSPQVGAVPIDMAPIATPGQVIYPMVGGSYTLTDGFGAPRTGRSHMGQDFAASVGTPIYAAADGCVRISEGGYGGYGETVMLDHPSLSGAYAVSTLYGHMSVRGVQTGQCVTAGQYLGNVGATGWVSGSCLHFEVMLNGTEIDPLEWLQANVR